MLKFVHSYYTLVNCKTHTITPGTGESWLRLLRRISDATYSQNTHLVHHDLAQGVRNGRSFYLGASTCTRTRNRCIALHAQNTTTKIASTCKTHGERPACQLNGTGGALLPEGIGRFPPREAQLHARISQCALACAGKFFTQKDREITQFSENQLFKILVGSRLWILNIIRRNL